MRTRRSPASSISEMAETDAASSPALRAARSTRELIA